jgi:hypothetical protein
MTSHGFVRIRGTSEFRLNLAAAGEKACYARFFTCGDFIKPALRAGFRDDGMKSD